MTEKMKSLQLYSLRVVAEILSISERSVYRLHEMGDLPIVKIGGLNRIRMSDLEAYVDRQLTGCKA